MFNWFHKAKTYEILLVVSKIECDNIPFYDLDLMIAAVAILNSLNHLKCLLSHQLPFVAWSISLTERLSTQQACFFFCWHLESLQTIILSWVSFHLTGTLLALKMAGWKHGFWNCDRNQVNSLEAERMRLIALHSHRHWRTSNNHAWSDQIHWSPCKQVRDIIKAAMVLFWNPGRK